MIPRESAIGALMNIVANAYPLSLIHIFQCTYQICVPSRYGAVPQVPVYAVREINPGQRSPGKAEQDPLLTVGS